ncbi:MAG: TolC family protein [Prevotella sp.]|uniref:TolC family protein n=1 Tax=Prevotella sp. RM4 TaxID=1200547 RepID=UPI00051C0A81|nr:TolC family protein [Prevotella sp. RM4]MBQ4413542.1 TolC family protein [Prevotella sp.]MBQ6053880.1 TolC family protein [Prevotella sp.]MBR0188158.1 TolC family protein [Prevotella sp.]MBR0388959.1 TolC family protein [Prevotella sp.]
MKKRLVVLSMLMLTLTISAQKKWTMQECIDYAMANNITLQKSKLQKQSATEDLKGSKAALLPTLNASTNQSVGYQPWKDSGVSTVTNGMVNTKVDKTYYNGSYAVNAQWTVWNGNRNTNTIKLNKITEDEAELQSKETANSIQERIAQLYTQILYLDENVKVNEQMLETAKKNEERGQEMVNVGKMSKADLAQLSAQRATDEYNIVETRSQLLNYKLQLKQLLEITDETEFDVAIPEITDTMVLKEVPTLQGVYEQALLNRPEIERSKLAIKSSDVNLSVAKAGWLPTVSMTGSFGTSTNSLSSNGWGKQMKTNFDAMAGVSVSVPIYDGRSTKTSVNKAKIQQLSAQLDLLDQQKTLYSTIQEYWLNAQTNQQKYKAACATVESEQQSFDLLQEQFRLGLKNIVELMTGKDNLLSAQQNQLQSKYQTIYNQQMLKFYETGEM